MGDAEKRLLDLLDRWQTSLDLHTRYLKLDDAAYAKVQPWPRHQRPNKWIIDLAKQRVGELRQQLKERDHLGDDEFADALELMGFLTSLLATEHIERFVPLAIPGREAARPAAPGPAPSPTPTLRVRAPGAVQKPAPVPRAPAKTAVTRNATTGASRKPAPPVAAKAAPVSRAAARSPTRPAAREPARPASKLSERMIATIVADAARFLDWGREWPQLAGLIARLADRPSEADVWEVLRQHRATIEASAKQRRG